MYWIVSPNPNSDAEILSPSILEFDSIWRKDLQGGEILGIGPNPNDWFPCRRKFDHIYLDHRESQREDDDSQAKEKGFNRNQPWQLFLTF